MKTRLLFVNWSGGIGGAEMALLRLMRGLDQSLFEFSVWAFQEGDFTRELKKLGISFYLYPVSRFRNTVLNFDLGYRLAKFLRDEQIDLVHANGTLAFLAAAPAARFLKKKIIWHLVDQPEGKSWIEKMAVFYGADRIICNSEFTRDSLRRCYPQKRFEAPVIYPPLGGTGEDVLTDIRGEFGIPEKSFVVLCAGRLQRWKGQDVLLKAVPQVLQKYPEAYFFFVGGALAGMEDGYENELLKLCACLGVSDRCRFTGFRKDAAAFFSAADLVIHTSVKPEPFGMVIAEAMAMGKAVIASSAGGPGEIIENHVSGILIEPGNSELLGGKIAELLSDTSKRMALGRQARLRAEKFSLPAISAQAQRLYHEMMENLP